MIFLLFLNICAFGNVIHTYYEPVKYQSSGTKTESDMLLEVWKRVWQEAGFIPKVLTEANARQHPDYTLFNLLLESIPLGNNKEYDRSCYMRYLAMAASGGGWMSDYDNVPLNMPESKTLPNNGLFTVYEGHVPSLISASKKEWNRIAFKLVKSSHPKEITLWSDMMALQSIQASFISKMKVMTPKKRGHDFLLNSKMLCLQTKHYFTAHLSHYAFALSKISTSRSIVIDNAFNNWKRRCTQ